MFGGGSVAGGGSGTGSTFMPTGEEEVEVEEEPSVKSSSIGVSKPSSSVSLSSLSAAPSLKSSSLGSLAPLAPLGSRHAASAGLGRSSASSSGELSESLGEEDARQVADLDSKIAATKKATAAPAADQSAEYVDESFAADSVHEVEEELEVEVEEQYSEEEF